MMFTVFNASTGEALKVLFGAVHPTEIPDGYSLTVGKTDFATEFVDISQDPPVITSKLNVPYALNTSSILADGVAAATFTGLPDSTTVSINSTEYTVDDNEFIFAVDLPGSYELILSSPIHLDTSVTITAT